MQAKGLSRVQRTCSSPAAVVSVPYLTARSHFTYAGSTASRGAAPQALQHAGTASTIGKRVRCHAQAAVLVKSASEAATTTLPPLLPLDGQYEAKHAFTDYANWLIPGALLLGRYPFVEPSRCSSREQGEAQLERILGAGIGTFVSLQQELPPQDKMVLKGVDGFLPYKPTAELIQSALNGPPPQSIVDGLRNPTLDKWLPPRRRKPLQEWNPKELKFLHCPVTDLSVPTQQQARELVKDLTARLAAGETLYVHCWGGRGRAGTLGACLLAAAYGLSAEEALERVQRSFDTRRDGQRRSPETEEQLAFVRQFVAAL